MLPAAAQGALGIEIRSDRDDLVAALAPLADQATWLAVAAERAVSRALGGSCSMPLAAHAVWKNRETGAAVLEIKAAWGEPDLAGEDGSGNQKRAATPRSLVRASLSAAVADLQQASALGERVAALLVAGGAQSLRRAP